jgi:ArsR family transcriptional regulator
MKDIPLEDKDRRLVEEFRALGHPARLKIILLLIKRKACICGEIVDELPLAQATVSQHLKVLKEAGLIVGEIDGPAVCYCLAPGALDFVSEAVGRMALEAKELSTVTYG